ncbi:MAG: hypothetical protein AAF618_01385 [Pseudomonadota bacterium]
MLGHDALQKVDHGLGLREAGGGRRSFVYSAKALDRFNKERVGRTIISESGKGMRKRQRGGKYERGY